MIFNRARWYDPARGRFISEDPKGLAAGSNLYEYTGGNPISRRDPLGMDWRDDLRNTLAQINEARFRAEQAVIDAMAKPIEFVIGFGDNASLGITRYIRQWQGIDDPSLDCSGWYSAGGWASVAVEVAMGGYGLYKSSGKFALKKALKEGDEFVDLFHGSYKNASDIYKNGLNTAKKGATNVSTDIDAAKDAIEFHLKVDRPPFDAGIVKSNVPKSELEQLIKSGDIEVRDYSGFYPYPLNTTEHLLITPAAKKLFNSGIMELIPYP